jgi:hypothetical protein
MMAMSQAVMQMTPQQFHEHMATMAAAQVCVWCVWCVCVGVCPVPPTTAPRHTSLDPHLRTALCALFKEQDVRAVSSSPCLGFRV